MSEDSRLVVARKQIEFARNYTLSLLEDIPDPEWFVQAQSPLPHVAWQVGHLAMAEYGLALFRQRGRRASDSELMSSRFRKMFSRGSTPEPDPAKNPPVAEIREVFHQVHRRVLEELEQYPADQLDDPVSEPYAAFATKLGALLFCSHHEMLHAGQIGYQRRLLNKPPLR